MNLGSDGAWARYASGGLCATTPTRGAHPLPAFDPWTLGISLQPQAFAAGVERGAVFRPQGWVSAVTLNGGLLGPTARA